MLPLPSYSQIADLLKKGMTLEAQEQIMQLRESALGLQEENLQLKSEAHSAAKQLAPLEEQLNNKTQLRHEPPVYYRLDDEVPFCPLCWERDSKLIHLIVSRSQSGGVYGECKVCAKNFTIKPSAETSEPRSLSRREMLRMSGL